MMAVKRVEVEVASPYFPGKRDRVMMRASETIRRLAAKSPERGGLSALATAAAGYLASLGEAAASSGVSGIDYSLIRVDTSAKPYAGPPQVILGSKSELAMIAAFVGHQDWQVISAIVINGETVDAVAARWPTAIIENGKADQSTAKAVGRRLRDALELVGARFLPVSLRPT